MCRKLSLKSMTTRYRYLTTDMEQSRSSEVNISSAIIDIRRILWDLEISFFVKNGLPLDPTLWQTNPVQALSVYKFKIYLAYVTIHVSVFFPSCYPTNSLHAFCPPQKVLHVSPSTI
jgi:hypothetical protein